MDHFDPYNVLLAIAINIPVLLMTAFVLQGLTYSQTKIYSDTFQHFSHYHSLFAIV